MLKYAYQLGSKIAELEAAALGDGEESENAVTELAQILQSIPVSVEPPEPSSNPGEPEDDDQYGESSINYAFDDLSRMGLDIQGPTSTAV